MLNGRLPFGVIVGVGIDVDSHALLVERDSRERHIALPADQAAHRPPRSVGYGEIVLVRIAPDQPLGAGRLELAVHLP